MQSVIGALRVNLGLDSAAFSKGLNDAKRSLKKVGQDMQRVGKSLSLSVSAPLIGLGAVTVKTAADFEASMNRVKAALGSSEEEFDALGVKARELGESTQFSASEAANAIEILAKNGVSSADILGGALDASLTLAAASASDMGSSADVATDVMLSFGKQASELKGVVDGVSGVLLESKFGFDDYRLAIGQAGGVAGGFGVELEDFNAVIAATSSSFASGSDAGTSFKTFLMGLSNDSKPALAAMETLGVEFFDAAGNMKDMADVAEELKQGVAGLSEESRNVALKDIFGNDALRTALALSREGEEGINQLTEAIGKASATEQAEARMDGLNGTLRELKSAVEELMLTVADSGLLDIFTSLAKSLTGLARAVGDADPKLLKLGTVFAALAAAIGPLLIGAGIVVATAGGPALVITAAIAGLAAAAITFSDELVGVKDAIAGFAGGVKAAVENLSADIVAVFDGLPEKMIEIGKQTINGLTTGIYNKLASVNTAIDNVAQGLVGRIRSGLGMKSPSTVFRTIGQFIMDGLRLGVEGGKDGIDGTMDGVADSIQSKFSGMFRGVLLEGKSFKQELGGILGELGGSLIDNAANSLFGALIPGFAGGTNYAPGGLAMVGERGPEMVNLPRGSQVIPNNQLPSGGVNITYAPQIDARGADPAAIARLERAQERTNLELPNMVMKTLRNTGNRGATRKVVR